MKTDELITLLSEDAPVRLRLARALLMALVLAVPVSVALLLVTYGLRPGMIGALETVRVAFKVAFTLFLSAIACVLVFRVGRPDANSRMPAWLLGLPLLMLAAAVAMEMQVLPRDAWSRSLLGRHAAFCMVFVPLLALAPLAGLLAALRNGAPADPGVAGAAAGLAAGSLGAAIYAWHCPDDSPLFVATWYGAAIVIVSISGFFMGRRLLRW